MTIQRVAAVQLCATDDVGRNLSVLENLIRRAADDGASAIFLPEAFSYIGSGRGKLAMAESAPGTGPAYTLLASLAEELCVDVIAGGFHEASPQPDQTYNTCLHITRDGELAASYRKIHLFDVALDDGTELNESRGTIAGNQMVTSELEVGLLGLTICYDLRFPTLFQDLMNAGCSVITVPSAFTKSTGAAHWHTLLRARAIECQSYIVAPAQHGAHNSRRVSFGHSLIIDPWGEVIAELPAGDGVITADLDSDRVISVRRQLPSSIHARPYERP
ncbi:MAG: carbon-nitrogen hydrolase family protein [Pseudomonadaceae bacterium]|nr:carbon-nitrogen hydrolase family protein [Pseudomonadaceae bacterium]